MTKLEQAAQALLEHWDTPAWKYLKPTGDLMADLQEALAEQAEQEPAGYFTYDGDYNIWEEVFSKDTYGAVPLYAAHVRTKDLTDDDQMSLDETIMVGMANYIDKLGGDSKGFRAVIAADREKNK